MFKNEIQGKVGYNMDLTEQRKVYIDGLSHFELLERWRFAPLGDPLFQGETGDYWAKRMKELRAKNPMKAVQDSKDLGWKKP